MAVGGIAALIALRYPEDIHIVSVVIGLMTSYIVIMIDYFVNALYVHK
jgi:ATP synthase protein I